MKSIGQMLEACDGLRDTNDVNDWENKFLTSVIEKWLLAKKDSTVLSGKQLDCIEKIYSKHFG